jgi:hypothetical protein
VWDFFAIILDQNPSAVNNTSSSSAYLVGWRKVLEFFGGFNCVREAIKEDVELGRRIKTEGFKLRIVKMDTSYSALWSRDLVSLWHGIRRTFFGIRNGDGLQVLMRCRLQIESDDQFCSYLDY